jgi:NADPH:quinone reductase-like Zn-dependent oxidoreductase
MGRKLLKAMVFTRYGPPEVPEVKEVEKPVSGDGETLIRIFAATVTAGDWRMRRPDPALAARMGNVLLRPKRATVPGFEPAGEIEAAGRAGPA